MYSLRRRILFTFTVVCFVVIFIIFGISYFNFRIFVYEIIQAFPNEMGIYLEIDGWEQFLKLTPEQAIFSLFIEKFQILFITLILCSVILIGFSLPFVSFFLKNILKNINSSLISNQGTWPQEFSAIQEQILIYSEEIAKLNNQNETFTSYASHELRNELAKLRSFYYKYDVKEKEILQQQKNIEKTIEDLLVLSALNKQVEIGKVDILIEIAAIIDNEFSNLDVILDYDEMVDYEVIGKKNWVFRTIYNLLSNAERYSCNNIVQMKLTNYNDYTIVEIINYIENQLIDEFPISAQNNGIGLELVKNVMNYLDGAYYYEISLGEVRTILSFKKLS